MSWDPSLWTPPDQGAAPRARPPIVRGPDTVLVEGRFRLLAGRHYYECPGESFAAGSRTAWRPALARPVEAAGGSWTVCEAAADGGRFVVVVNDRAHPSLPRNPAAHDAAALAGDVYWLGNDWAAVSALVTARWGAARAARLLGQLAGGE